VVAPHILSSCGHDICEYVHHVLVHFGPGKDKEGTHHSPSISNSNVSSSITKLERQRLGRKTTFISCSGGVLSKLLPQAAGLFCMWEEDKFLLLLM
jgi:hypothetical protein